MKTNLISFFDPLIFDASQKLFIGQYGEWFFNFNCKIVYQIRTDPLKSSEGVEVIKKEHRQAETILSLLFRLALTITVIPAVIALIDKSLFRFTHQKLHLNPLPDMWRGEKPGLLYGKKRLSNGFFGEGFVPDVKDYIVNSVCLYVSREHPWLFPEIQILEIGDQHEITCYIYGTWDSDKPQFHFFTYDQSSLGTPEAILTEYIEKHNYNSVIAEKKPENITIPESISKSPYFRGIYESIQKFNEQQALVDPNVASIFYSYRHKVFILQIGYGNFALKFINDAFEICRIRNKIIRDSCLENIVSAVKKEMSTLE